METKTVLQEQLDQLLAQSKAIENEVQQRLDAIQKLNVEIEQRKGAYSLCYQYIELIKTQLAKLMSQSQ